MDKHPLQQQDLGSQGVAQNAPSGCCPTFNATLASELSWAACTRHGHWLVSKAHCPYCLTTACPIISQQALHCLPVAELVLNKLHLAFTPASFSLLWGMQGVCKKALKGICCRGMANPIHPTLNGQRRNAQGRVPKGLMSLLVLICQTFAACCALLTGMRHHQHFRCHLCQI